MSVRFEYCLARRLRQITAPALPATRATSTRMEASIAGACEVLTAAPATGDAMVSETVVTADTGGLFCWASDSGVAEWMSGDSSAALGVAGDWPPTAAAVAGPCCEVAASLLIVLRARAGSRAPDRPSDSCWEGALAGTGTTWAGVGASAAPAQVAA